MKIDVIIVNWNSGTQLQSCIESVRAHHADRVGKCIVVDNGSVDGSTDFLTGADDVDLVLTGRNLGFGAACNVGAARGDNPFVLLLNPDACLQQGSLDVPLAFMLTPENEKTGIAGIALVDEAGVVQRTCARSPTPLRFMAKSFGIAAFFKLCDFKMENWDHSHSRVVGQVMGAFFMVRRNLWDELNGLDERFFVYFEEVDFSYRALQAGYTSMFLTDAQAFHEGGGVSEQVKAHRLFYSLRSRIQYAFKHFGVLSGGAVAASTLLIEPFSRAGLLLARGRVVEISDLGRGYVMLWGWAVAAPFVRK